MFRRKVKKFRADKVSIEGHYEAEKTARASRRVWVPDQLVVECGCGTKMRPAEYPNVCECGANHTALVHEIERVLAESSISLQYRDHEGEKSTRVVYKSDDILRALTRETSDAPRANVADPAADVPSQSMYSAATSDNEASPSFCLEDAIVVGKLDLKHRTSKRPIVARNCWFMGQVDLRYCEFEQAVYFLDCTFYQEFNSGDTIESHTIYRKELNCNGSHFKKATGFNGIEVESTAYFHNTRFELEEPQKSSEYPSLSESYAVDFATASFGHHLECKDAVFEGCVSFNSIKCGRNGQIDGACFEEEVDFTAASFGWNFECTKAEFKGEAIFNSLRCDGNGHFDCVCFEKEVDFTAASFGWNFECTKAEFKGEAIFNSLRCGGFGFADSAHFREKVDLKYSSWKFPIVCENSRFWGEVDCSAMSCARDGNFVNTRFESDQRVIFAGANFGGDLRCECAVFKGMVNLKGLKCDGAGRFQNATFVGNKVDYQYSYFGGDLDLRGAYFAGKARLARVSTKNKLRLGASCFMGEVELFGSEIKILELIDANYPLPRDALRARIMEDQGEERKVFAVIVKDEDELRCKLRKVSFKKVAKRLKIRRIQRRDHIRERTLEALFPFRPGTLNLTDISFERFHGGPNRELARELALRLCEGQDPTKFSRDPYLQLKKYYSSIGEDDDALDIHYRGRNALRKNAKGSRSKSKKGRVHWSWPKIWITDSIWKWFTGYGQKMYRLLLAFVVLVTFGTAVLWSDSALTRLPEAARPAPEQQGSPKLIDRIVYSVDLLIPVLDLRAGDARIVDYDSVRWLYEVFLILAGWLLIALLIAWITAVAKGDR